MPPTANSTLRSNDPSDGRPLTDRAMGVELDNIFRLARGERAPAAPPPAPPETRRVTQSELDAALDMLNRAAQAMDVLQSRYLQVESYARDVAERAERDLSSAHDHAKDWEARAVVGETLVEDMRMRLAAAERRAEQAERRVETAERRADQAEQGALEARDWLGNFYDKIVAALEARPFAKAA